LRFDFNELGLAGGRRGTSLLFGDSHDDLLSPESVTRFYGGG